jgi:hypothetical protein
MGFVACVLCWSDALVVRGVMERLVCFGHGSGLVLLGGGSGSVGALVG